MVARLSRTSAPSRSFWRHCAVARTVRVRTRQPGVAQVRRRHNVVRVCWRRLLPTPDRVHVDVKALAVLCVTYFRGRAVP